MTGTMNGAMNGYDAQCRADARLAILAELARQADGTLSNRVLAPMVELLVPRRPAAWVDAQLVWLGEMGAVRLTQHDIAGVGWVIIATLTRTGRDHVERRAAIPGVATPADID